MRPRNLIVVLLASLPALGCTRSPNPPGTSREEGDTGVYDPEKDPLVNPPSLFEPYPEEHPEMVAEDETLVRIVEGNPTSLNPIFMSSTYEFYLAGLLFDGLFSFDAKMEWFVNDEVVEHYEESEDHLVSTIRLRPGLKWHDGHPWTAHDVRFSWEVILDERVPCPAVKPGTDKIKDVKVVDDLTLQFVHEEALPTNKWNMLFPIIPRHIFGKEDKRAEDPTLNSSEYYNHYARNEVIGNGPYRFVRWIPNDRIIVERWDDYHGKKPHFKRQILRIQPDSNVAFLLFQKEEVDEIRLTPQQFATQAVGPDFARVGVKAYAPQWAFYYVGWNMDGSNPFFTDVRVRRAMAHAFDVKRFIRTACYNLFSPCYGIYHPDSWMFNPEIKLIPYDLDAAARLLDEAGWKINPDLGGWRYKTIKGEPVKFEFTLLVPQGSTLGPKLAALYQQTLRRLGISLLTRTIEWAAFMERTRKHEFEAMTAGWGTGTDPDTGWNLWRSDQYETGRNYVGYKNPRVDELFELGRREFDREKRKKYYQEIQKIIYEEQPYLFVCNTATTWAFHKRLRGIQFSPRGVFNFDPSWRAWWVPKDQKLR